MKNNTSQDEISRIVYYAQKSIEDRVSYGDLKVLPNSYMHNVIEVAGRKLVLNGYISIEEDWDIKGSKVIDVKPIYVVQLSGTFITPNILGGEQSVHLWSSSVNNKFKTPESALRILKSRIHKRSHK